MRQLRSYLTSRVLFFAALVLLSGISLGCGKKTAPPPEEAEKAALALESNPGGQAGAPASVTPGDRGEPQIDALRQQEGADRSAPPMDPRQRNRLHDGREADTHFGRQPRPGAASHDSEKAGGKPGKDDQASPPTTWKRDGKQPTFARVYVGDKNSLELVSMNVTVTVEGSRARTLVDHIFRNPHDRQLEGTFEYPMPAGASPSYFAMFLGQTRETLPARFVRRGDLPVLPNDQLARLAPQDLVKQVNTADWGQLQEARVVSKQKALEVYEDVVRGRVDPALLEYAGGNTFSGRVFPIPPKGYNRVLIAYEELLPISQEHVLYKFPLPDCKLQDVQFTLNCNGEQCKSPAIKPDGFKKEEGGSQLSFTRTWTEKGPGGEVVFSHKPANPAIQTISARQTTNGPVYTYVRVRPELKALKAKASAEHAVFLLDTSMSESPDRFNVSMKLLKKILEGDTNLKHFNILAFNVGSTWVDAKNWLPNTEAGRETAMKRLDGIALEGATDLSQALDTLAAQKFSKPGTPMEAFLLSDGQITWGEADVTTLVGRFQTKTGGTTRFQCYRTGLGADNLELYQALTRRSGGIYNCFTEADLAAASTAHRQQCMAIDNVRFVGGGASDVMVAGRQASVYPGGEIIVAAKLAAPGQTTILVEGTFMGEKLVEEYPVDATGTGELAPRGWGEIAVASLLALNDPKYDTLVTAYCQEFGIGSKVASFLVLENTTDYKRLDLEKERGQTLQGDMGKFLNDLYKVADIKAVTAKVAFRRFLDKVDPQVKLLTGAEGAHVKRMLELLKDADYDLPEATIAGALLSKKDVPPTFLAAIGADKNNVETYLAESKRRLDKGDADGAIRVLSTIVEQNAARGDALRMVGYRLLDLKQPTHAVRLFDRVQHSRPFEPHSYLDLARSLEESGKYGLAAVQYEIVMAGTWHGRFHESLKEVAREDYGRMMRQAIRSKTLNGELADHFGERLEKMDPSKLQSDLRVSMTWNTDATDVDLWVIEPDGTKCFYSHNKTKNGGDLSQDMTQGYGPERFQAKKAMKGEYKIMAHYFAVNPNLIGGESTVSVTVTRNAGTALEVVERHTVILKKHNDAVEVCKVNFK